jgi:uncharacterized BrkB/YihY/UPF0761 family membrane protein
MRIILAVLVMASYLAGLVVLSLRHSHLPWYIVPSLVFVVMINFFCSWYLYMNAPRNKVEWALLGLIGNINAVIVFWVFKLWVGLSSKWSPSSQIKQGKEASGRFLKGENSEKSGG